MATGPEHYAAAERCIAMAEEADCADADADAFLREAQAHATLALAAATAWMGHADLDTWNAWRNVAGG